MAGRIALMRRRRFLETLGVMAGAIATGGPDALAVTGASVSTLLGTGAPGFSDAEVNNPYGIVIGPDKHLYFCDLDNQRIRRMDLATRRLTTIAGSGRRGY